MKTFEYVLEALVRRLSENTVRFSGDNLALKNHKDVHWAINRIYELEPLELNDYRKITEKILEITKIYKF